MDVRAEMSVLPIMSTNNQPEQHEIKLRATGNHDEIESFFIYIKQYKTLINTLSED